MRPGKRRVGGRARHAAAQTGLGVLPRNPLEIAESPTIVGYCSALVWMAQTASSASLKTTSATLGVRARPGSHGGAAGFGAIIVA
jgi:hypothetical protein